MKLQELKNYLDDFSIDFYFQVNNQSCGIETVVDNYVPTFTLWYGEKYKDYHQKEDLITDPFFDGKSLKQLLPDLDIELS